jgi:hypothetical protein
LIPTGMEGKIMVIGEKVNLKIHMEIWLSK